MTRARKVGVALTGLVVALFLTRAGCMLASRMKPPGDGVVSLPPGPPKRDGALLRYGESWLRKRGSVWELGLAGPPTARGGAVSTLLRKQMVDDEHELYSGFEKAVPFTPARWAIMDLGRFGYRHVDQGIPEPYRFEILGIATGFQPDPFTGIMPSYQRFTFLYAVYDIALSFEKSPLIGCTTFTVPPSTPAATGDSLEAESKGHAFLARNFDFEAGDPFDRDKVVYLVREADRIPFASVGWPGFVGVVSGMNREGVALVVHGGRASQPKTTGIPVVFSLREALGRAKTTEEAVAVLSAHDVMVSHIVIVTDPSGDTAVVERAPGKAAFVRRTKAALATTNHFEGPLMGDPRDTEVRAKTSTLARRKRGDALVAKLDRPGVASMVDLLRDKKGPDGEDIPLGDRRAIDALIATHAVVFDATARTVWVSEFPHVMGRFVRFDLRTLLADGYAPTGAAPEVVTVPADPLLTSGGYDLLRLGYP